MNEIMTAVVVGIAGVQFLCFALATAISILGRTALDKETGLDD